MEARRQILKGRSVRDLAKRAGISHPYLGRILRGERRPVLETANAIASACGLTLDAFYTLLLTAVKGEKGATKKKGATKRVRVRLRPAARRSSR